MGADRSSGSTDTYRKKFRRAVDCVFLPRDGTGFLDVIADEYFTNSRAFTLGGDRVHGAAVVRAHFAVDRRGVGGPADGGEPAVRVERGGGWNLSVRRVLDLGSGVESLVVYRPARNLFASFGADVGAFSDRFADALEPW